jgi:hypothetical protein
MAQDDMLFLLLNLLQQARLPKVVIIGAVLLFIAGVSLLVYFYRRYQRTEKEPEEEWDLSRRSLFVSATPHSPQTEDPAAKQPVATSEPVVETMPLPTGGAREFASEKQTPSAPTATAPESRVGAPASAEPAPQVETSSEERATRILASPSPIKPVKEKESPSVPAAFDEEVWTDLDLEERPLGASEPATTETAPLQAEAEPPRVARVEQRSHRESFESPPVERITHREPYEPPRIAPLTPREQAAVTRDLQSTPAAPAGSIGGETVKGSPNLETRELAAEPAAASSAKVTEPSIAVSRTHRAPAGSVLGLPAETSNRPLILGDPVRPASETGINALTNYGKDVDHKGGRGGTIALFVVVLLFGGALLLYFFVPSVHSRAGAFVAHLRGTDLPAAQTPKAQIIPSTRPEVNKNMVKARGAVDNISDAPLENLSVEVALQRGGDAPPEIRTVSVIPSPLPPNQRGTFEFEYDGKRDTGFAGYKITRLLSNGTEIKFRAPNQK